MLCLLVPPVCFRFHSFAYLYFSIRYVIFFIHFSTVLLDSRLGFNSSEIFLHAVWALCFLTIRGFRPIIGPAVFALLVTKSRPLLSFFLCCHLSCCFHRCYCFPHLESKRAKETDLLPCLQGTEIVLPPSLRYWIGASSRIQGRSHRHFQKTAARIPRFHCKNHRKKGQMDREKNNFVPTSYVRTCTSRTK